MDLTHSRLKIKLDAIWSHMTWSTLVQIMTCCLTAPGHFFNRCSRIIGKVLWLSREWTLRVAIMQDSAYTGAVLISHKTSHRKISRNLVGARSIRVFQSVWNLTGASAAVLPRRLPNFKAIQAFQHPLSRIRDFARSYNKTSDESVPRLLVELENIKHY